MRRERDIERTSFSPRGREVIDEAKSERLSSFHSPVNHLPWPSSGATRALSVHQSVEARWPVPDMNTQTKQRQVTRSEYQRTYGNLGICFFVAEKGVQSILPELLSCDLHVKCLHYTVPPDTGTGARSARVGQIMTVTQKP